MEGGRVAVRLLSKLLLFYFISLENRILAEINVLRGTLKSEMVEGDILMKTIRRVNLDLILT